MLLTALWILMTVPGCVFAALSIVRGRQFVKRTLETEHPELLATWRIETLRDLLLAAVIGCLVFIGVISAVGLQVGPAMVGAFHAIATVGLFVAALLLDLMAYLNYSLRWSKR